MHIPSNNVSIYEFIGWHMGDGCISVNERYSEYALTGDLTEEIEFYENIVIPSFNKLFNKNVSLKRYKSSGVCGIYLFDKDFVSKLVRNHYLSVGKKKNSLLQHKITDTQKIQYLRGLVDTDGSIYFCRSNYKTVNPSFYYKYHYKPKIKIATISKEMIIQANDFLRDLGFSPRYAIFNNSKNNELPIHSIVLDLKKDVEKWISKIGFRNSKHQTKVAIWEKFGFCPPNTSLSERRNILCGKVSIESYYN